MTTFRNLKTATLLTLAGCSGATEAKLAEPPVDPPRAPFAIDSVTVEKGMGSPAPYTVRAYTKRISNCRYQQSVVARPDTARGVDYDNMPGRFDERDGLVHSMTVTPMAGQIGNIATLVLGLAACQDFENSPHEFREYTIHLE